MLGAWDLARWLTWLLVFVRVAAVLASAPIYGSRNIPAQVKVGLSLAAALLLFLALPTESVASLDLAGFVPQVIGEALIGLVMGFAGTLLFTAVQVAGQVLDIQMGFGMVNLLDPQSETPIPLLGNFYYLLALLAFLAINGHHWFIASLAESYQWMPLGSPVSWRFSQHMVDQFAATFELGVKFSAPALAALILTDIALAVLSRTVPQLQVFFLGAPLKIAVGMVVIMISLPLYFVVLNQLFARLVPDLTYLLRVMGG